MKDFTQQPPAVVDPFAHDPLLRAYLRRVLPPPARDEIEDDLSRFARRTLDDLPPLAADAEANPPRHVPYDAWGHRIDEIVTSWGWRQLDRVSAEEGMVAIGYERRHGPLSRLHQFAKLYLFNPVSAIYTCPLAMTDGAARLIELLGDEKLRREILPRFTSRDPDRFWTSGQWMTERTGGSDVGRTATVAHPDGDGQRHYRLSGIKWFTSATTAQAAMTLARIVDAQGETVDGSRGLSLFFVRIRDDQQRLNNIEVMRLKDKLGTRALPTAELELRGTPAVLLGAPGAGVRNIAHLLNITRIYNAVISVSFIRQGLALARDYAPRREAFGRPLSQQPLHLEVMAELELELRGAFHLSFHTAELLGKVECNEATEDERATWRLLTPLAKLFSGKRAVAAASEILESFGGAGYLEDTGLPRLLRDAQVLSIWEGTTNVLSLDALRAIEREEALAPFLAAIERRLERIEARALAAAAETVRGASVRLGKHLPALAPHGVEAVQASARRFAYGLARSFIGALMLEHAQWALQHDDDDAPVAVAAAQRWCRAHLAPLIAPDAAHLATSRLLAGY